MTRLCRLLYYSRSAETLTPSMVSNTIMPIMETALQNNPQLGITGALLFSEKFFLQAIEGDPGRVSELFLRIAQDPRHTAVTIADCRAIRSRAFDNWGMTFLSIAKLPAETAARFGLEKGFDPGSMDARNLIRFMEDVLRTGQVIRSEMVA